MCIMIYIIEGGGGWTPDSFRHNVYYDLGKRGGRGTGWTSDSYRHKCVLWSKKVRGEGTGHVIVIDINVYYDLGK